MSVLRGGGGGVDVLSPWPLRQRVVFDHELASTVRAYDEEGYEGMTYDRERNEAYVRGIEEALGSARDGVRRVLEVGPGADAVLTRMALDAHDSVQVVGIEGNPRSAMSARRVLAARGYDAKRVAILQALSTAVDVRGLRDPAAVARVWQPDALLHEILGYFASREGAVYVLRDLLNRLPQRPRHMAPSTFGTFYTPSLVDRRAAPQVAQVVDVPSGTLLLTRMVLRESRLLPFWPQCGTQEWVDWQPSSDWNADGFLRQHREARFVNASPAPVDVNSITWFIWAGFRGGAARPTQRSGARDRPVLPAVHDVPAHGSEFVSAFVSGQGYSGAKHATNWLNPVLLFEQLTLQPGDALHVRSFTDLAPYLPTYRMSVHHVRGGGSRLVASFATRR